MDRERPLMEHLQELRGRVVKIAIVVGIITALSISLRIQMYDVNGYEIPLPYPDPFNNMSIQLMTKMQHDLVPENVTLIQQKPGEAFFAQFYVAILMGVILGMPVIVRELTMFIAPGLYQNERKMMKQITIPAVALFAAGCLFSYFVVIPYILNFLYLYGQSIGINTFLNITEFVSFVMQFLIAFGVSYELPIIMWAASVSGMVEPRFWRDNIRYAVVIIAIFGAVITPDGSGVTMWFVAGPMILLYLLGMLFIERKVKESPKIASEVSEADSNKLREVARSLDIDYTNKKDEELREEIEKVKQKEKA
jgi:sec-independent protein translocase protein TatC